MKRCTKCGIEKEETEFCKASNGKNGLASQCRQCKHDYNMVHKERLKIQRTEFRKNNVEKLRASKKKYYEENKEKCSMKNKQYYKDHRESIIEHQKNYYNLNILINRHSILGKLELNSKVGFGILMEYVVANSLKHCTKCTSIKNYHARFDIISPEYGTINVKASSLKYRSDKNVFFWGFRMHSSSITPDNYICIATNQNKEYIEHVWIIPSRSNIFLNGGLQVTNSKKGISRLSKYEVDNSIYNNNYLNINLENLPEFCNLQTVSE